jgi:hypothetical protein
VHEEEADVLELAVVVQVGFQMGHHLRSGLLLSSPRAWGLQKISMSLPMLVDLHQSDLPLASVVGE